MEKPTLYTFIQAHTYDNEKYETNAAGAASIAAALPKLVADYGLESAEVVDEEGPSGGWPDVKFVGTKDAVMKLLVEYFGHDQPGEAEEMFNDFVVEAE